MKKLLLLLTVITLTFQSCSSNDPIISDAVIAKCISPINLSVSEITEVSAVLNWETPNNSDVKVEYGPKGFVPGHGAVLKTSQNSISIDGLTPGASYDFVVKASCAVGNISEVSSFKTNECQIPVNLSVSEIKADGATLNWENLNVSSNVKVEYGLTGFVPGNGTVVSASQNSISIDGLNPDTSYDFYVQAACYVNNFSGQSVVGTFTTNTPSPFAGTWSGTYDGDDSGTWTFVVSVNSIITESTAFSNNVNATQQGAVGVTIPASGAVTGTAPNGTQTSAQITGDTLTGTWVNPAVSSDFGGTLTGSRE